MDAARRIAGSLAALTAMLAIAVAPAQAATKLAFYGFSHPPPDTPSQIYSADADGTHVTPLLPTSGFPRGLTMSPDGEHVALGDGNGLTTVDVDGQNPQKVCDYAPSYGLSYTPDGSLLVPLRAQTYIHVFAMHPNGTGLTDVTKDFNANVYHPSESKFGTIAVEADGTPDGLTTFGGNTFVYLLDHDGGNPRALTTPAGYTGLVPSHYGSPAFSPDGSRIAVVGSSLDATHSGETLFVFDVATGALIEGYFVNGSITAVWWESDDVIVDDKGTGERQHFVTTDNIMRDDGPVFTAHDYVLTSWPVEPEPTGNVTGPVGDPAHCGDPLNPSVPAPPDQPGPDPNPNPNPGPPAPPDPGSGPPADPGYEKVDGSPFEPEWGIGVSAPGGFPLELHIGPELEAQVAVGHRSDVTAHDDGGPLLLHLGPASFDLRDMRWHVSGGAIADDATLDLNPQFALFPEGPELTKENGEPAVVQKLVTLSAGEIAYNVELGTTPIAFKLKPGLTLKAIINIHQTVAYLSRRLILYIGAEVLTRGRATKLILEFETTELRLKLAVTVVRLGQAASAAAKASYYYEKLTEAAGQAQLALQLLEAAVGPLADALSGDEPSAETIVAGASAAASSQSGHSYAGESSLGVTAGQAGLTRAAPRVAQRAATPGADETVTVGAPAPASLTAHRLTSARGLSFGRARLTAAKAKALATKLLEFSTRKATVRRLLLSRFTVHGGQRLSVLAGRLTRAKHAVAEIELIGPGYRGEHLVATRGGAAGAVVTLPRHMKRGTWTIGVLDYRPAAKGKPVLVDAATIKVK